MLLHISPRSYCMTLIKRWSHAAAKENHLTRTCGSASDGGLEFRSPSERIKQDY